MIYSINIIVCERCGYYWYSREAKPPKVCANKKCKSPYWNKKRTK